MKINIVSKLMEAYAQTPSPFTQSTFKSQGNFDYIAGAFFIALALLAAFFIKRAKENLKKYKAEQLKVYNENNKTKPALNYESTSLYIPF